MQSAFYKSNVVRLKRLVLLTLCSIPAALSFGEMNFEHIGTEDGLSQILTLSIYQDKLGYMWFGTREGLNRYDGRHIKTFYSDEDDASGLSSNIINTILHINIRKTMLRSRRKRSPDDPSVYTQWLMCINCPKGRL